MCYVIPYVMRWVDIWENNEYISGIESKLGKYIGKQ